MISAYRVGILLRANNQVSNVLHSIQGDLRRLHGQAEAATDRLRRLGGDTSAAAARMRSLDAAVRGVGVAFSGWTALSVMRQMSDEGQKILHQQGLIAAAVRDNVRTDVVRTATDAAYNTTAAIPGTSVSANLSTIAGINNLTNDWKQAAALLPSMSYLGRLGSLYSALRD